MIDFMAFWWRKCSSKCAPIVFSIKKTFKTKTSYTHSEKKKQREREKLRESNVTNDNGVKLKCVPGVAMEDDNDFWS